MPVLSRWFIRASLAYLVAGFSLGALMLAFKACARHGVMWRLFTPHVEFLLIGWTVQLTMGVAFSRASRAARAGDRSRMRGSPSCC
jgi:uncharacterized membrane protein YidH (DUF202 family)